jgi:hypothetical protein
MIQRCVTLQSHRLTTGERAKRTFLLRCFYAAVLTRAGGCVHGSFNMCNVVGGLLAPTRRDDAQHAAIEVLDDLHVKLTGTVAGRGAGSAAGTPPSEEKKEGSWFTSLFSAAQGGGGGLWGGDDPHGGGAKGHGGGHGGVYMYGGPGCGKTFCMVGCGTALPLVRRLLPAVTGRAVLAIQPSERTATSFVHLILWVPTNS